MLAHPVHPLLNLVDEGADNIHKNPVDTSSKRPLPANRVGGRRVTKAIKHRKTSTAPPERMDWRLNDSTFDQLDAMFHFTLEACCDDKGLNGHCKYDPDTDTRSNTVMPFCSPSNSILNRNVVGESIFVHPPWSKATAIVSHIRRCHAKDPQNTLAIFVLPKFPAFAPVLEGLRLLDEQLADRTTFTKSPPTDGGVRNPVYPPKTPLCFWVLDKDTPVLPQYLDNDNLDNTADDEVELNQDGTQVSENIILDDNLADNNESDIEINLDNNNTATEEVASKKISNEEALKADGKYLPTSTAHCTVLLDPEQPEPLMRQTISIDGHDVEVLYDSGASLNFMSKKVQAVCKTTKRADKLPVRVANGQRMNANHVAIPDNVTIDEFSFTGMQFRVLPQLKVADVIIGLSGMKQLGLAILPSENCIVIQDKRIPILSEERRVECSVITPESLDRFVRKQMRSKKESLADLFVVTLSEANQKDVGIDDITTDFGDDFTRKLKLVVEEYADVAGDFEGLPPLRPGFDHKVKLTSTPKRQRRSRLSHPQIQEVVRQCTEHFKQGRVQVSTSPHAAPIILIRKPDGSMRMCIDYRSVNTCSERDSFPLPRIDDLLDKLRDAKIMTHLDLNQAYHQVRMDPDSVSATAFQGTTPSGAPCLLEFLVMPFGLQGAGATFTRLMNHVLEPYLNKFVLVYLDDICIFSSSEEEHLEHLSLVLAMLKKHQLRVRLKKCHWGQKESEYLGVIAGNGHLRCSPAKLSAVKDWPVPSTQKEIKSFVQFCSFYRKFVHHFSDCSAMLTDLCRKNAPQKVTLDDGALTAFETLKARLCSAPLLLIPKTGPDAEFVVATDASDVGIGAVLLQEGPTGDLQPVAYFGRKLNPAQRRYSAYDKEAYAAVTAVCDEWKVYLEGCRHFTVITDHATLTHLQSQSSESLTNRQQHYVEKIQPFAGYMSLIYRKGCLNEADPISRRPDFFSIWGEADVNPSMVDLMALHVDNITVDGDFERKLKGAYSSCKYFSDATRLTRDKIIKGDDGLFRYLGRIVIPHPAEDLRKNLLHEYHDCIAGGGHSSPKRTLAKIMEKFWWRQMSADVQKYCRECVVCKRAKPVRRGPAPLDTLPVPDHPWQIVGLDYVTSLPESGGPKKGSAMYNAILVVCCLGGGGAHFIPCRDTVTAEESADLFLREVVRLHGVPSVLVSDRDPKFVSDFWQQLWRSLGTKLNMSTARRAQTDGKSERTIGSAQCLLRCYCAESGFDWLSHLPMVEFAFNSQENETSRHCHMEYLYGYKPPMPADLIIPAAGSDNVAATERAQRIMDIRLLVKQMLIINKQRLERSTAHRPRIEFVPGDYVYLSTHGLRLKSQPCRKLRDRNLGPFRVLAKIGLKSYRLDLPKGYRIHNVFHIDLLSKASVDTPLRAQPHAVEQDGHRYDVEYIADCNIAQFRNKRGKQLQFLVKYVGFPRLEWNVWDGLSDDEGMVPQFIDFLRSDKWQMFVKSNAYVTWISKNPAVQKYLKVED